jgi:hypothetical protein
VRTENIKKYINPYNLFVGSFIPNWLLRRSEVSPGAKLCYARLAQFAGKDGDCFPSQATLAIEIGAGERQIRRYITELEEQQLIDTVQVGLNQPNHYRFLWHPWMEEEKELRKGPSGKSGKGKDSADRTHMTTPDRTDPSRQERSPTSAKENHLIDSKTTTEDVVVDEDEISKVKKALSPIYMGMPETVIADLIERKGLEHVLSIAEQTAYQYNHKSREPENPTGHFVALTMKGMNRPQGYLSREEKAQDEKNKLMRTARRRKKTMLDWKERVSREQLREFIEQLNVTQ